MKQFSCVLLVLTPNRIKRGFCSLVMGWLAAAGAMAQPVVTTLSPVRNAGSVAISNVVTTTFSQALTPASSAGFQLYSQQAGGKKAGNVVVNGNTLEFDPATNFKPGETITAILTRTVASSAGTLARAQVWQFTTAVAATPGTFNAGSPVSVGRTPQAVALADIDGDGDLDMLAANSDNNYVGEVSIRFNDGTGAFTSNSANISTLGKAAQQLAVGDLDGDGDLDVVATVDNSTGMTAVTTCVRLNNGSGAFTSGSDLSTFANLKDLKLADVDGDGDLDILAIAGSAVLVRTNNGAGAFSGAITYVIGTSPFRLAVGDVDNDGDQDLVASNFDQGATTVALGLNNGSGGFTAGTSINMGALPTAVALQDVDGDGDLDLLACNGTFGTGTPGTTVAVRLNNGAGLFSGGSAVTVSSTPNCLTTADVDGDGDFDLLVGNPLNHVVNVRLNAGNGTFVGGSDLTINVSTSVNQGINALATGDVDGDGDLDVAAAMHLDEVSVSLNNGSPPAVWAVSSSSPGRNARAVVRSANITATFSQPLSSAGTDVLRVFGQLSGRLSGSTTVSSNVLSFDPAANFKPGERISVSLTKTAHTAAGIMLPKAEVWQFTAATAPATGFFGGGSTTSQPGEAHKMLLADADADGDLDIFTSYYSAGTTGTPPLSLRRNNGNGTFAVAVPVTLSGNNVFPSDFVLGDVDGDGDNDLLLVNFQAVTANSAFVQVLLNNGQGSFSAGSVIIPNVIGGVTLEYACVALGDVDGDGDLDVVLAGGSGATILRLNNGQGTFFGTTVVPIGYYCRGIALADLNNDGSLDLITSNSNNTVHVRLNDGTGVFVGTGSFSVGAWWEEVYLGDVDNDGDLDMFVPGRSIAIWLNDGRGSFSFGSSIAGNPTYGFWWLATGDIDGDGDLDLVLTNSQFGYSSQVAITLLNNGSGTFTNGTQPGLPELAFLPALGDLDGDGDIDLVTAAGQVRFNQLATATRTNQVKPAFRVWPNPAVAATGWQIALPAAAHARLVLQTLLGQTVRQLEFAGTTAEMPTAGLAAGSYLLVVEIAGRPAAVQRVMVQ